MRKLTRIAVTIFTTLMATATFADLTTNKQNVDPLVTKSLDEYKVCDTKGLATQLSKQYAVVYMPDDIASYHYYLVRNPKEMNVDRVRKEVCQYVMDNSCFLYWGNVANMAMFAEQKAAWFPADTSPHYMLSPLLTCDKLGKKK